jgi:exodeoxyribonuclease V alpha subunit
MDLVIEFKNVLSLSMIKKIYDKYSSVEKLKSKLKAEPYTTLTRISGIGFKKADSIVLELQKENVIDFGYDVKTSPDRCLACTLFLLSENENNGHTRINLAELRQVCLSTVPECIDHFDSIIDDYNVYYNKETMDIALKKTYETEAYIAETILSALNEQSTVWEYDIEKYRSVSGFDLSDEQIQILDTVCKNNICILNGFAGSGKTASTQGLINMLKDNYKSFKLFSPTGKAAKVLAENTGESASTIHRGLGYVPPGEWTYNSEFKLDTDIVIVDEFSMVDIWLFKSLLDAIDFSETKLLLIGDNAQLPSVSSGNLLHDFMESNIIPTVTLTKVFRYGEGGLMKIATDVRCCKPYLSKDMQSKMTSFGENQDYTFIDLPTDAIPQNIVGLYKKLMQKGYKTEDIQVLTAKKDGDCGVNIFNSMIQKVANPNYGSEVNMKMGDTTYYVGDLVLQKANNYEALIDLSYSSDDIDVFMFDEAPTAFVANGETGVIRAINKNYMTIEFDGIFVKYFKEDLTTVGLGYVLTIHKSQGSGIKIVILCTPQSHIFMLNSNLLYVGLTRMKQQCYHLGSLKSVNQATKKKANLSRNTFMQQLLKG